MSAPDGGPAAAPAVAHDTSAWPLLRHERTWGAWRLGVSLVTVAAATWCYVIGENVGYYLRFGQGVAVLMGGSLIGMLMVTLAVVPTSIRFGVDSITSAIPAFGSTGWIIPAAMQQITIVGWNSLLLIFFAKSTTQLLLALHLVKSAAGAYIVPATVFLACSLVFVFLLKGARGVDRIAQILVAHVFLGLWMLYLLLTDRWADLQAAIPPMAGTRPLWNYTTGLEIAIVSLLSWWPYTGAMVRMAPRGRIAALPIMLGMGLPVALLSIIGVAAILVLKVSDPSAWLRSVGGPAYGIVALVFVAAANLGTAAAGVYASSVGLRHFKPFEHLSWPVLLLLTILPVALVGLFVPELFFANFSAFLALVGVCFAPLCGIQIADYYVLRRRRIDIRALFVTHRDGAYRFWAGFNPAALLGMLCGCSTYVYLLNPLTYASRSPYEFLTASLPSAAAAGIVHVAVTRWIVQPAGKGGYPGR